MTSIAIDQDLEAHRLLTVPSHPQGVIKIGTLLETPLLSEFISVDHSLKAL